MNSEEAPKDKTISINNIDRDLLLQQRLSISLVKRFIIEFIIIS